jgi:hypothetical protein
VLERPGDLAALLTNLEPRDVLFIDEIHRLSPIVEEILYPALEDFQLDIMIGEGPAARSVKLDLPAVHAWWAQRRVPACSTNPLRDRFGIVARLEFYNADELTRIVLRSATLLKISIEPDGAREIARRSRGTPRIANRLLRRVRDFAEVKGTGEVTRPVADAALSMLDVDGSGLDVMDRKLLHTVLQKFAGGPVGVGQSCRRHRRGAGYDRGCAGAISDPARVPATHVAWPHRHRAFLPSFRIDAADTRCGHRSVPERMSEAAEGQARSARRRAIECGRHAGATRCKSGPRRSQ